MKTVFVLLLLATTAYATEATIKSLVDHYNSDGELGRKNGSNQRTNEDRGYLVSIEASALIAKSDLLYVYTSTLGIEGAGLIPIGLKRTPEFSLEFDSASSKEIELQRYNQRLAKEGGGDIGFFKQKQKVRMWVQAKPAGFMKFVNSSGSMQDSLAFDVVKVCQRDFKKCHSIKADTEKRGILDTIFGLK